MPKPRERRYLGYEAGRSVLRRRLLALIIDNLLFLPLLIPCVLITKGNMFGAWSIYTAAHITYFFLFEAHCGQTLGKRAAGLRVVRVDGRPVDAKSIGARNVLRLVDGIPGIPLLGALAMTLTGSRRRRIGDLAAGTVVVEADAHPYVRAPRSPWITMYPALWLSTAAVLALVLGPPPGLYIDRVDAICKARVERYGPFARNLPTALDASRAETREIANLRYPAKLDDTHREIVEMKVAYDGAVEAVLRDMRAQRISRPVLAAEGMRLESLTNMLNARFREFGLSNCSY